MADGHRLDARGDRRPAERGEPGPPGPRPACPGGGRAPRGARTVGARPAAGDRPRHLLRAAARACSPATSPMCSASMTTASPWWSPTRRATAPRRRARAPGEEPHRRRPRRWDGAGRGARADRPPGRRRTARGGSCRRSSWSPSADGSIRWAGAGHPGALLRTADGEVIELPSTGPVLGPVPGPWHERIDGPGAAVARRARDRRVPRGPQPRAAVPRRRADPSAAAV